MKLTRRGSLKLIGATALAAAPLKALAQSDGPQTIEVQMMNKNPDTGEAMSFYPEVVRCKVGDTIKFVPTDRGHNSTSTDDMMPDGAEGWKGKIGQEIDVTLTKDGAYGFHCVPHQMLGMVGLILCGDVSGNYDAVKAVKQRGKAKQRYDEIFAMADKMLASEAS